MSKDNCSLVESQCSLSKNYIIKAALSNKPCIIPSLLALIKGFKRTEKDHVHSFCTFLEYEDVVKRAEHRLVHGLSLGALDEFLAELAALIEPVEVHFQCGRSRKQRRATVHLPPQPKDGPCLPPISQLPLTVTVDLRENAETQINGSSILRNGARSHNGGGRHPNKTFTAMDWKQRIVAWDDIMWWRRRELGRRSKIRL